MTNHPVQQDIIGQETLSVISGADKFNSWMYAAIKPHLHGRVLELGSGTGNISRLLLEDRFTAVLSDYNTAYIHLLKEKFSGYANLQSVLQLNLQDPDFETENQGLAEQFDTVFLLNVIEHLQDDNAAVSNCKFMLKEGGRLILLAPAYHFLYCDLDKNLGHYRRYTSSSLAGLLERNQLLLIEKKYFNLAGIMGWLLWGKLGRAQQLQAGSMRIFNMLVPFIRLADRLTLNKTGLSVIAAGKKV